MDISITRTSTYPTQSIASRIGNSLPATRFLQSTVYNRRFFAVVCGFLAVFAAYALYAVLAWAFPSLMLFNPINWIAGIIVLAMCLLMTVCHCIHYCSRLSSYQLALCERIYEDLTLSDIRTDLPPRYTLYSRNAWYNFLLEMGYSVSDAKNMTRHIDDMDAALW